MFNDSTYPFNFMTTGDGVDSDIVIPDSFGQCLSYEQQIAFILNLIENIDSGVVIPEITADATVDQSTGTPSVTVVRTGEDEAPVFTFNFHNIKGETGERGEKGETGETGATGRPGNDGADGVSPTVTTTAIPNGYRITITDADGSHVFDIYNGNDGETGPAGYSPTVTVQTITGGHSITITDEDGDHTFNVLDGTDGSDGSDGVSPVITSTAITGGHRITIVDAQGTTYVDVMDGATGATGNGIASTVLNQDYTLTITYTDGTTYTTPSIRGAQGASGQNGTDGISPTVTVRDITGGHQIEIVSAGGTERFNVMDGVNGTDGSDGQDGVSPTVSTTAITDGTRVTITDVQGSHTFDVMNGTDGTDGTDGSDGAAATIQVGTVTTGAAGTNASVTNRGTSSAAVFDFTIPRGADGQTGARGPRGYSIYRISVEPQEYVSQYGSYVMYSGYVSGSGIGDTYLYGSNMYTVTYVAMNGTVYLDNKTSIAPSGGNTKGFIRFGDDNNNYKLNFTTDTVYNNLYTTSFTPNDRVISLGGVYYPQLLELEISEVIDTPTIIIKPAGRISNSGWYPNINIIAYDATDGNNTLSQYACFNLTCRFDNDNTKYIWDSSLSDIKTALLSGTTYPILFEPHLVPNMIYGTNDVKQVFISSGSGTLSYDSTSDDFVINISEISVFKATAGEVEMFTTYES